MPYRYAQIQNGLVFALTEHPAMLPPAAYLVFIPPGTTAPALGSRYTGAGFLPPDNAPVVPDAPAVDPDASTINMTLSAGVVAAGTPITWGVTLTTPAGDVQPYTQTYYVPVFRQDGWQIALVTVPLVDGQASGTLTITEPGIYTLDLSKARPVPTAKFGASPELIVTG